MEKYCRVCNCLLNIDNQHPSNVAIGVKLCKSCQSSERIKDYQRLKLSIITKLGLKCACCNRNEYELMTIDHIHGGGGKQKKTLRGHAYLVWLDKLPFDELLQDFRCLCYNCNYACGFWGECPHTLNTRVLLDTDECKDDQSKEAFRKVNRLKLKLETMLAYGNECAECGERETLFLTLDHINQNGKLDREDNHSGIEFYAFLRKKGFPGKGTQLQVLCHSCNAIDELKFRAVEERVGNSKREVVKETYIDIPYALSLNDHKRLLEQAIIIYRKLNPGIRITYKDGRGGKINPTRRITVDVAEEIRTKFLTGNYTRKELADAYKMTVSAVSGVIRNETYKKTV